MKVFSRVAVCLFVVVTSISHESLVTAAITTAGDVNPAPPTGGGTVSGALQIGISELGIMDIAGGTALTNGGPVTIGNQINSIGIVTMGGFGSDWTMTGTSSDMTIGSSGSGSISLSNFARMEVGDDTILGVQASGTGEINISDLGTVWDTDSVILGQSGTGIINIFGGGQLVSGSSIMGNATLGQGRVTISDALSQWRVTGGITLGQATSTRGTISIFDGGTLRTTGASTIGNAPNSVGLVEVNGPGALWNAVDGGVSVATSGTGTLHVFNGGRIAVGGNLGMGTQGNFGRGEIWVDGLNSVLSVSSNLSAGNSDAQITISNGGIVTTQGFTLGTRGRVLLSGGRLEATEVFNSSGIVEGSGTIDANSFNNQLSENNRGRLWSSFGEKMVLTGALSNSGAVEANGGELEVIGNTINNFEIEARNGAILRFGGNGLTNTSNSQFAITAGDVDIFGNVAVNVGSELVVGNESSAIFHDTLTNNGDVFVMPGSSLLALENLDFLGDLSNLNVQLGSLDAGEETYALEVAGSMILEGDLSVSFTEGYEPQEGDMFPLLIAGGGRSGIFFNENLPSLSVGLAWETIYTESTLSLAVVADGPGSTGDFDNDGDVDGRDFLVWQRGASPSPLSAGDLADWQANYGPGSLVATNVAVPEPASFILLSLLISASIFRRN